jgi:hypothetical protein
MFGAEKFHLQVELATRPNDDTFDLLHFVNICGIEIIPLASGFTVLDFLRYVSPSKLQPLAPIGC